MANRKKSSSSVKRGNDAARPTTGAAPRRDAGRPRGAPVEAAVLSSVLAELAAHGLRDLSVERVAMAAEVNKTSIYRRWPTREALVTAALLRVRDDLALQLKDKGSLSADLLALGEAVARLLDSPAGQALVQALLDVSPSSTLAPGGRRGFQQAAHQPVVDLVSRAHARGEWRPGVSPETVLALLVGAMLHRRLLERRPTSRAWLRGVVDVVVAGIAPRTTSGSATR